MTLEQTDAPVARQGGKQPPTLKLQRTLAMILLLCQGGITVTGSLVRVTGSGLGCNTWPLCHEGSLVPVAGAAPWIHQTIEFGNRLLTFVVAAAAIAVLWAVYQAHRGKPVKRLAWFSLAGVVVQAVLGGISVRLDLQWWAVAVHFLPSMVLVWVAAVLYMRLAEDESTPATTCYPKRIRTIAVIATVALSCVLVTGTMVTGSGPHSGDASVGMEGRLAIDTALLAYVHAACMYVYLLFTVITFFMLRRANAPHAAQQTSWFLLGLILVQWAVGLSQYYMGVPRWTIPVHIGLSSLVVAFTAFLYTHAVRRELL